MLKARMDNVAVLIPAARQALTDLGASARTGKVPATTATLVHLRASQVNGCSWCVDMHARELREAGATEGKVFAVSAWRDSTYFNDAERAALALAECVTRLSDRADPVPDEVWDEAARHYDHEALAALLVEIAVINAWNRLNVATRQVAGGRAGSQEQARQPIE